MTRAVASLDSSVLASESGAAIARRMGLNRSTVNRERRLRGIVRDSVDWAALPFMRVSDYALAKLAGVSKPTVRKWRRHFYVPPGPPLISSIDPSTLASMQGMVDAYVASVIGCTPTAVRKCRDRNGIKGAPRSARWKPPKKREKTRACECCGKMMEPARTCTGATRTKYCSRCWCAFRRHGASVLFADVFMSMLKVHRRLSDAESAGIHSPTNEGVSSENQ